MQQQTVGEAAGGTLARQWLALLSVDGFLCYYRQQAVQSFSIPESKEVTGLISRGKNAFAVI
jgi:hypothetical protein